MRIKNKYYHILSEIILIKSDATYNKLKVDVYVPSFFFTCLDFAILSIMADLTMHVDL